jgi:peroxiredoxin
VAQLRRDLDKIRAAGADLYVIGSGTPDMARDFERQYALDIPVLVDPERAAFRAAGLKRGVGTALRPSVVVSTVRALARGHLPGKVQGDPWQQGGVLVIAPPGRIVYEYASKASGDHPRSAAVLKALEKL